MTGEKLIHGYLDKLGRNIQALDAGIESVRKPAKGEKPSDKRARLKLLRDLVELQNASMATVKAHLLGRDETGSVNEPDDIYAENAEWEFERDFKRFLEPWIQEDIEFECNDCGVKSDQVDRYTVSHPYPQEDEHFYLCDKCYEKRTAKDTDESEESSEASDPVPNLKEFARTQGEGSVDSTMSEAVTGLVGNTIRAVTLEARSPLEMVKMLEDFKAHLVRTAHSHATGDNIEPGIALLDKEIERLKKEAELGKGQEAAGKPAT